MYIEDFRYVYRHVSENTPKWKQQGKKWADIESTILEWAEDRYAQTLSKKQVAELRVLYEQFETLEKLRACTGTQNEPATTHQRNRVQHMEE